MKQTEKKHIWEILSLILLTATISSLVVNLIVNGEVSWSVYPIAVCATAFSYLSLFAFWPQRTIVVILASLIISSILLWLLDVITGSADWAIPLALPILFASNIILVILILLIRYAKYKGLNVIGYCFIGASLLCVCIEGTLSLFRDGQINLSWSLIVSANSVLIAIVLFFVHLRLKKGRDLKKTFHL